MSKKRQRTLVACLWMGSNFGQEIFRGICKFAHQQQHWTVIPLDVRDNPTAIVPQADGLITHLLDRKHLAWVRRLGLPTVSVYRGVDAPEIPLVTTDDEAAGRMAAQYLLRRGHRHLAFVVRRDHTSSELRRRGFRDALRGKDVTYDELMVPFDFRVMQFDPAFINQCARWLRGRPRPLGIAGWGDAAAAFVVQLCARHRLKVPEQVSVLGIGNDPISQQISPVPLSSVALSEHQVGYDAAGIIDRLWSRRPFPSKVLLPPVKLFERISTDWLAVDDPLLQRAMGFIRENAGRSIYVEDVMRAVGLSRRPLEKRFRQVLGHTPNDEIIRVHLERAKELLVTTTLKLEEIAQVSGLENGRHLSVLFKAKTGLTPSGYRSRASFVRQ